MFVDSVSREAPGGAASERSKLVGRAGVVGAGTLASRILGLGRDVALAAIFTRDETDAFFVAFTLPNLLRQLLGEGAVSGALVPVLSDTLEKGGDEAAQAFFARARGLSLLALTVVTVLGMLASSSPPATTTCPASSSAPSASRAPSFRTSSSWAPPRSAWRP